MVTDRHTDTPGCGQQTTVTLAAHTHQGLIILLCRVHCIYRQSHALFLIHVGVHGTVDYSRYPSEATQKRWITHYLKEATRLEGTCIMWTFVDVSTLSSFSQCICIVIHICTLLGLEGCSQPRELWFVDILIVYTMSMCHICKTIELLCYTMVSSPLSNGRR